MPLSAPGGANRTFLVECYAPGIDAQDVSAAAARARQAAGTLFETGIQLHYLGALFVAADEVVFHAFSATDRADVERASTTAGLQFERIVESVSVDVGALLPPPAEGRIDGLA
jgi:hypothetical protein